MNKLYLWRRDHIKDLITVLNPTLIHHFLFLFFSITFILSTPSLSVGLYKNLLDFQTVISFTSFSTLLCGSSLVTGPDQERITCGDPLPDSLGVWPVLHVRNSPYYTKRLTHTCQSYTCGLYSDGVCETSW